MGPFWPSGPRCFLTQHRVSVLCQHVVQVGMLQRRVERFVRRERSHPGFLSRPGEGVLNQRPQRLSVKALDRLVLAIEHHADARISIRVRSVIDGARILELARIGGPQDHDAPRRIAVLIALYLARVVFERLIRERRQVHLVLEQRRAGADREPQPAERRRPRGCRTDSPHRPQPPAACARSRNTNSVPPTSIRSPLLSGWRPLTS